MFKQICLAVALLLPSLAYATNDASACKITETPPTRPPNTKKKPKGKTSEDNKMFLSRVVCEVEQALDAYQQSADVEDKKALPKIATADFDFKTIVDTKGGFTISFLIFKFGTTVDKQDTNDVDFQYVPKSLLKTAFEGARTKSLQQELIDTIGSAAKAIVDQGKMPAPGADP